VHSEKDHIERIDARDRMSREVGCPIGELSERERTVQSGRSSLRYSNCVSGNHFGILLPVCRHYTGKRSELMG